MSQLSLLEDVVTVTVAPGSDNEFTYQASIGPWCGRTEVDGPGLYWYIAENGRHIWHCGLHGFEHRSEDTS